MSRNTLLFCTLMALLSLATRADEILVGDFSRGDLSGWREESFAGHTQYQIVTLPLNSRKGKVLQARSQGGTASGLLKKVTIDLTKTPWLNWSWRIDNTLTGNNERTKRGDDYPARLYVVVSGGLLFWKTRAINYVWSSNQPLNSEWDNTFTSNAKMVAVQSGAEHVREWLPQRRNVHEDLKRLFGEQLDSIDAVALMTDSDNTGQSASALYGDIYFSSE